MSKLFQMVGSIILCSAVIFLMINGSSNTVLVTIYTISSTLSGLAFLAIGNLLHRVDFLEKKLKVYHNHDKDLPQITCPNCKTEHDFDFPKCPQCKHKY